MFWRWTLILIPTAVLLWALYYWLFVITEGLYFGRRIVVWLYDLTADTYDDIKQYTLREEQILVVEPLLGELGNKQAPLILDVATGTGRVPFFLAQDGRFINHLNGRVVALDPAARMLQHATQNLRPFQNHVDFVQQVAVPLPFRDGVFDAVVSLESIEFFPSDEAAVREMIRVLKPAGFLMITRRTEWEAYTFFDRYRSRGHFAHWLEDMGMKDVLILDWQSNYDLVIAQKPLLL